MHRKVPLIVIAIVATIALGSCGSPSDGPAGGPSGGSVVTLNGQTISAPTTWTKDHLYYVKSWIAFHSTLTIEPGTIVAFGSGATMTIDAGGRLVADGTDAEPILFTSAKEDFEDFDIPGISGSPARGDWDCIFVDGDGSSISNCRIRYAHQGLQVDASDVIVWNDVFTSNDVALDARSTGNGFEVGQNTFYGNVHPFYAGRNFSISDSNVFQNGDGSVKNTFQAIELENGYIDSDVTWSCTKVAFATFEPSSWLTVSTPHTLRTETGVVVKFSSTGRLTIEDGASLTNYSNADFTSTKDDLLLGDSNGDGSASAPGAGDWDGIWDYNTNSYLPGAGSFLHYSAH